MRNSTSRTAKTTKPSFMPWWILKRRYPGLTLQP